jgi:hypothetical protein
MQGSAMRQEKTSRLEFCTPLLIGLAPGSLRKIPDRVLAATKVADI